MGVSMWNFGDRSGYAKCRIIARRDSQGWLISLPLWHRGATANDWMEWQPLPYDERSIDSVMDSLNAFVKLRYWDDAQEFFENIGYCFR